MKDDSKGFRVIYAKRGSSPKNKFFEKKMLIIEFLLDNLDCIDYLSVNDVLINKDKFIDENKLKIDRYLKIKRIYDI